MTLNELIILQNLPLEIKIMKTQQRIKEWVGHWGLNGVYVSYSGGKDSEVLVDIARTLYPDIKIVFSNTGQEFPEIIKQVMKRKKEGYNIDIVIPRMRYKDVIEKYGYPVITKEVSMAISRYRNTKREDQKEYRLYGSCKNGIRKKAGIIPKKYHSLAKEGTFKISEKCCDILKKEPLKKYEKKTGRFPIIGTMASESVMRRRNYLQDGCNAFNKKIPHSTPLGFWTEDDIWNYIKEKKLEISEIYTKHNMRRSGCYGCLFGCHLDEVRLKTNRIIELKKTHPLLYEYLMKNLDYKNVMEILGLMIEGDKDG